MDIDAVRIHTHPDAKFSKPLVVIGVPTLGLVGIIAAQYVSRRLEMERVGSVHSARFPPVSLVDKGLAGPAVRLFAKETSCGFDLTCNQLVVVTAEFTPGARMMQEIAEATVLWAKDHGSPMLILPDGVLADSEPEEGKVWGAAALPEGVEFLRKAGIDVLEEGVLGGISGAFLAAAERHGLNALCLLADTRPDHPDARAAAAIVEILDRVLPDIDIGTAPLLKEAEQIEDALKTVREKMGREELDEDDHSSMFR